MEFHENPVTAESYHADGRGDRETWRS